MQPADIAKLPERPGLRALDPGSMLLVVLGTAFHGRSRPRRQASPKHQAAVVRFDAARRAAAARTEREEGAVPAAQPDHPRAQLVSPDTLSGDKPVRRYFVSDKHKVVRLVFKHRGQRVPWGIEETDWDGGWRSDDAASATVSAAASSTSITRARGSTWSSCGGGRLLGDQYLARFALERDDARDRQGPQTANNRKVGSAQMEKGQIGSSAPAGSVWSPGALFAELGHEVVIRDVVAEKIATLERGEVPFHEEDVPRAAAAGTRRVSATRSTCNDSGRLRVPVRLRRHAADAFGRRGPFAGLDGRSTSCRSSRAIRSSS